MINFGSMPSSRGHCWTRCFLIPEVLDVLPWLCAIAVSCCKLALPVLGSSPSTDVAKGRSAAIYRLT